MLKKVIIVAAVLVAVFATTGATIAYIFTGTPPVENNFETVYVSSAVEENFDGDVKTDVRVRNTGAISAYVRAVTVVTWAADDGTVYGTAPIAGTDYSVQLGSAKWSLGTDGFYYYSESVSAGSATEILISSVSPLTEAPAGYHLSVSIYATAIQAEPAKAATEAWGVTILPNGNLVAPR